MKGETTGETTRRATRTRRWSAAVLLLWVVGCGGLVRSPGPGAEEVEELKRLVVELQRQARVNEVEVARLQEEIAVLEKELATARAAADREAARGPGPDPSPPPADEEALPEPLRLAAGIEETELEESEAPPAAAPAEPALAQPPASPEALRLYDQGYTLFHQKRYDQAEERFRRFLALHGETELADNAQFWIGECRYARDDFAAALEAFTATVELYPQGNKVADALLKAGKCLERLGRGEDARQTYLEITDRFPTSSAAVAARERLEALP